MSHVIPSDPKTDHRRSREEVPAMDSPMFVVDDLIQFRAAEKMQKPILAYPKSKTGLLDFEYFTATDLNRYINAAVATLQTNGVNPALRGRNIETIAMLGPSNLEYIITMLAFSRLGYAVFILSPRLSKDAYVKLLGLVNCHAICFAPELQATVTEIGQESSLSQIKMLSRADFQMLPGQYTTTFESSINKCSEHNKTAFIMHSSGSTGLPKPIYQTHQACLGNYMLGHGMDTFLTVPLYHTHGHACFFRSIYKRCCTYFLNSNLPVTSKNLMEVVEHVKPGAINAVPYNLKLLAESKRGLQAMANCTLVSSAGSALADELGDRLVSEGIHIVSLWGSTETGAILNSMRPFEDKDWAYMSIVPSATPYVWMKQLDESTHELVALEGLKSKVISNSSNPPNSFHTKDIFAAHPTKKGRWKHLGRLDDRIVLSNGEKVLPLAVEGRLRQDLSIREAVMFGINRSIPGLLLFRSQHAAALKDEAFLEQIMPAVGEANVLTESFAQIIPAMIIPFGVEVEYPQTDKGTFIRAQVYRMFAQEIETAYRNLENTSEGTLRLSKDELESFILCQIRSQCSIALEDIHTDFFAAGVDSLQAIKFSSFLRKELFLGGNAKQVDQSTIFEKSNAARLAEYLFQLQTSVPAGENDEYVAQMSEMIRKYSSFEPAEPDSAHNVGARSVLLTGATGSLGAHVLDRLLHSESLAYVYCLVRASSPTHARERVLSSLEKHGLDLPSRDAQERIICLPSDFSQENLGLQPEVLRKMKRDVSRIIHSAWAVNFNWNLSSFEDQYIKGTYNLLQFALSVKISCPIRFIFCSSVSVATRASREEYVPETLLTNLSVAGKMGYAQSKMVTEHIVDKAARLTGMDAHVMRIGQIVGSQQQALWNDSELVPLVIRSSLTLGSLPQFAESCRWLPVDCVAQAIVDVANITGPNLETSTSTDTGACFYNVVNLKRFSWNEDLLPALRQAGLRFRAVSTKAWLRQLQESDQNPLRNPTIKLLPLLLKRYEQAYNQDEDVSNERERDLHFATDEAQKSSLALRSAPDVVESELIERFVKKWLEKWASEDAAREPSQK